MKCIFFIAAKSEDISAFSFEYEHAKQEGIQFHWKTVAGRSSSVTMETLATVECARVRYGDDGEFRESSRFRLSSGMRFAYSRDRAVGADRVLR